MKDRSKVFEILDFLYSLNYRERPVTIEQFIKDDYFLGRLTNRGKTIYPGWLEILYQIFSDDTKYIIVFTGAIGLGKTYIACAIAIPYILYRISCLKDPWAFFGLAESGKLDVSFFNLTKSLLQSRGFQYLQTSLKSIQWFKDRGLTVIRGKKEEMVELSLFNFLLSSPYARGFGVQGGNVVCGIMDEVDSPTESVGQKKRVLQAYEATIRRFESRYVVNGQTLGKLFLVASKQDELSFLNVYIEQMKDSPKVLIFDKALWELKPRHYYSGATFKVMVGDAYTPSRILDDDVTEEEIKALVKQGFRIISIPVEYRSDFELDIIGALRDLAGIAVRGIRRYKLFPTTNWIRFDETKRDPITVSTLEVGLQSSIPWIQFFDFSALRIPLDVPRFIHLDISISGDAMGLAASCVAGWQDVDVETEDGSFRKAREPIIETEWILRVKAKPNDRIPLSAMRKFILDLKNRGYRIKLFSADLKLASEDTLQILQKAGIETTYFSVDRNTQASLDFRNLVFEQRWLCHKHEWLFFEMKHIEYNRETNKVDHPDKVKDIEVLDDGTVRDVVMEGSKDCFDAVVGSVYQCLKHAKEALSLSDMQSLTQKLKVQQSLPADSYDAMSILLKQMKQARR